MKEYAIRMKDYSRAEWDSLLARCGNSNLLQSWAYGEAKKKYEGWNIIRASIEYATVPVAIVQVLEKKWPVFGGVVRINRGPLWIKTPDIKDIEGAYLTIRDKWNLKNARVLFFAPELSFSNEHCMLLRTLGFRTLQGLHYKSIRLNLGFGEDDLRKSLDGKWRNMLSAAEKSGLTLEIANSTESFDWLMGKYKQLRQHKKFNGIHIKFLSLLREQLGEDNADLLVLRCRQHKELLGGILIARHGPSCTYLVGYNGENGRRLKAGQFLLWNAATEMKKRGCKDLDLGGINYHSAPSIASFKMGMGGIGYELVGDWFSL